MDCDSDEGSEFEYFDNKFIALDKIVQCLLDNGLLTDIECRNIVFTDDVEEIRAAIYSIICTKNLSTFQQILKVFRNNVHPLQSPKILGRIFSFLKYDDIANCRRVCGDWKALVDFIMKAKYDEINMDQLFLDTLKLQQKLIMNPQTHYLGRRTERQARIFTLCLAIKPDKDETLHELLQTKSELQANVNDRSADESYVVEDPRSNLIPKVLSNHTVLNTMFKFLSLQDIKACRIVCRNWNSVAESCLRKVAVIQFRPSEDPSFGYALSSFANISKYTSLPNLPFTAFKFIGEFPTYELTEFFSKVGKDVQILYLYIEYGISSCLSQTVNLTELNLQGAVNNYLFKTYDDVMIPWNKLHSIKVLNLSHTLVKVYLDTEKKCTRIIPLKININNVRFFVDGKYPAEITLNTFMDFSKVKDVHITGCRRQVQIFDWGIDTFDADKMTFTNVQFVNAMKSKSAVDHLKLYCTTPFAEKANLSAKQILFEDGTIKLSALPQSVEKLGINVTCRRCVTKVEGGEQFQLPNLNYLSYRRGSEFNLLSHFGNCYNLTDLEISQATGLDMRWLPRSVKRLKLETRSGQVIFVCFDGVSHDLDLLILNYIVTSHIKHLNFEKLRPKVLVLQIRGLFDDKSIVEFLQRNKRIGKIYMQFMPAVASDIFDNSEFSRLVDKASDYYEFSNERGNAITFEEFFIVKKFIDVKKAMKGFWNSDGEQRHKKHNDGTSSNDFDNNSDSDDMSDNYIWADPDPEPDPDSVDEDLDDDDSDDSYW